MTGRVTKERNSKCGREKEKYIIMSRDILRLLHDTVLGP